MAPLVSHLPMARCGTGRACKATNNWGWQAPGPGIADAAPQLQSRPIGKGASGGQWAAKHATAISTTSTTRRSSCAGRAVTGPNMRASRSSSRTIPTRRSAGRWPCHGAWSFPISPDVDAGSDPAIWHDADAPSVVVLAPAPDGVRGTDPGSLLTGHDIVADRTNCAGRHLVIAGRSARHRLLVKRPDHRGGHAFVMLPDEHSGARMASLAALLLTPGRVANGPSDYQRHRLNLMLAILDRLLDGQGRLASIRELAEAIVFPCGTFGRSIEWKTSSWRRQTQRLVREAIALTNGGYRKLLYKSAKSAGHELS